MLLAANIFQPIIDIFAAVLKFFHNDLSLGWGLAIVLLTVCVRLALVPIGIRQFHSMQRMAMHTPEMKKIREKYKDNPQRMQQETMKFYKENNINPFATCLPLLIQWPFLIGLFWTLRGNLRLDICPAVQKAYQIKYAAAHHITDLAKVTGQTKACGTSNAHFLFIHDLTNSPHGVEIGILLVLYIGTSIGSSMIMMMPGTEANQRRLMLVLPVIFAVVTIRFPAGALLYYIIFNLWMVLQQSVFKELIGKQYRPPEGAAIGIHDGGSISSGGGLRGLFGLNAKPDDDNFDDGGPGDLLIGKSGNGHSRGGAGVGSGSSGNGGSSSRKRGSSSGGKSTSTVVAEPKTAGKSSGSGKGEKSGADNGASNGNANGKSPSRSNGAAPPPPPRKRKKRSGRRR